MSCSSPLETEMLDDFIRALLAKILQSLRQHLECLKLAVIVGVIHQDHLIRCFEEWSSIISSLQVRRVHGFIALSDISSRHDTSEKLQSR